MGATVNVEIDKRTADALQARADEFGVTVRQLIAELAALDGTPRNPAPGELEELDRRAARSRRVSRPARPRR